MLKKTMNTRLAGAVSVLAISTFGQIAFAQTQDLTALPAQGFVLSIDGTPVDGDQRFADRLRQADVRLNRNDIQVTFDGFGVKPTLNAQVRAAGPLQGQRALQFKSETNYPAFIKRGEIRLYTLDGSKLLAVAPIEANGESNIVLPGQVDQISYSYRVYDAQGRFDQTYLQPLETALKSHQSSAPDEGKDNAASRAIPIRGGSVSVYMRNMVEGSNLSALGTTARAGKDRNAVINRILPVGAHDIEVQARGQTLVRPVVIPNSDWFATGVADFTYGRRQGGFEDLGQGRDIAYGRLQGYAKGHTANGWEITASADTREDEFKNLLRNVTKRDPRSQLSRLDPDLYYQTYGDDSSIVDDTPTSTGIYVKAQKENSHALLGNFKSSINSTELLRNERAFYGVQGVYRSTAQTSRGEARIATELYGAQPDQLPRRDQFRGTGGSSYFLSKRDVIIGSETVQVEIRDPDTGRVINRQTLAYGRDYEINYSQGLVMLKKPLSSFARDGGFMSSSDQDGYYLIAQYEYEPLFEDLDSTAFGGRAEAWLLDGLRVGVTKSVDKTGQADQTAEGGDLRLQISENSHIQLEQAKTDGPGFTSSFSADGGLTIGETGPRSGTGRATRVAADLDTKDLGVPFEGNLNLGYENREAGFATFDRQTDHDVTMGHATLRTKLNERNDLRMSYNHYVETAGDSKKEASVELGHQLSTATRVELGYVALSRYDRDRADRSGRRDDLGMRLSHNVSEDLNVYAYGVGTVQKTGGISDSNRLGVGSRWQFAPHWNLGAEISDGTAGAGALTRLDYNNGTGSSAYLGYALDPDQSDLDSITSTGSESQGELVWGGKTALNDSVTLLNENSYDIFGEKRSLISAYGVEYAQSRRLTHDLRYEYGRVYDDQNGDVNRNALSIGSRYDNQEGFAIRGRLELRRDRKSVAGSLDSVDSSVLVNAATRYQLDESQRLSANVELLRASGGAQDDRDYTDVTLGYALRPIEHDRWTLLMQYRYKYDLFGQVVNGTDNRGPRQRSNVFSVDGNYRISDSWTLGGKIGARLASTQSENSGWVDNDAWLGVLNARYHLVNKWDLLVELRQLKLQQSGLTQSGALIAGYRHVGDHTMLGVGYNFSDFSDDLTDLVYDDKGVFVNLVFKY